MLYLALLLKKTNVEKTVKILVFSNEIEASLLDGMLTEREIPHLIRSYHDSVYDGLWQTQSGWGHLEAKEEYRKEILKIFEEMSQQDSTEGFSNI